MFWMIAIVVAMLLLVIVFALLHNNDPIDRAPEEICEILRDWLNDKIDWKEWDYFESCDIKNPVLNEIKNECMKIDVPGSPYMSDPEMKILNKSGKKAVAKLLEKCESLV
ncbi:hypothetical protein [Neptuniibacter pectenicola]|uniref:hypothetical protein n=1 Tax=Neptuniibacter pectenicola TaxID=1806669 RepID=UPI00082DF1AF|nr:hypothetical protein [Neptuniibacter pectenicola]